MQNLVSAFFLCKEFIEKHKGRLYAKSELGVGSTFCFELPI